MRGVQLALASAAILAASISPYEQIADIREHIKPARQKRADPAKRAARKRQRKARAITKSRTR